MSKKMLKTIIKLVVDPPEIPFYIDPFPQRPQLPRNRGSWHRPDKTISEKLSYRERGPSPGSLVYCQLVTAEHSGIYIGNNQIVHLNGRGEIEVVSLEKFTDHLTTLDLDIFVPIGIDNKPVGSEAFAANAKTKIGEKRSYNLIMDNCHQFSAGCISGNFENADNFLWMTKDTFRTELNVRKIKWVRWSW